MTTIWIAVVQNGDFLREIDIYTADTDEAVRAKVTAVYGEIREDDDGNEVIGESSFPDDEPGYYVTIEPHEVAASE